MSNGRTAGFKNELSRFALLRRLPWHIDAEFQKNVAEGVHLVNAAIT